MEITVSFHYFTLEDYKKFGDFILKAVDGKIPNQFEKYDGPLYKVY